MDANSILDRRRLKRRLAFWRIAAVLLAVSVVGLAGLKIYERQTDHIARVAIKNIIVSDPERSAALAKLAKSDRVKAVVVRINSPGGTTTGSENLYRNLRLIAEEKPVVAVIGTLGASGGYIAAIGADRIFARETSITGSIGVIMQTTEFSGLLDKIGISIDSVTSGRMKGKPSPSEPMDEETRAVFQSLIDDAHRWFKGLVTERRGLTGEKLAAVSDGRVFTGKQAVEKGLVDALGGETEALDWLRKEHKVAKDLEVKNIYWGREADPLQRRLDSALSGLKEISPHALDGLLALWQPK